MVVGIGDGDLVLRPGADVERIVELVVSRTLRAEPGDARVLAAVHADRVVGRIADDAVAVGTHGHRARVVEFAEAPLGQRRAAGAEYLEPLLQRVRHDDVVLERDRRTLRTNLRIGD